MFGEAQGLKRAEGSAVTPARISFADAGVQRQAHNTKCNRMRSSLLLRGKMGLPFVRNQTGFSEQSYQSSRKGKIRLPYIGQTVPVPGTKSE